MEKDCHYSHREEESATFLRVLLIVVFVFFRILVLVLVLALFAAATTPWARLPRNSYPVENYFTVDEHRRRDKVTFKQSDVISKRKV